jgi:SAM-dependent methyltransferase
MIAADKLLKARHYFRAHGFLATASWALKSVFYHPVVRWQRTRFDRKYGTETSKGVLPHDFDIDKELIPHVNPYSATPDWIFVRFLRQQKIDYSSYTFVDLGCGKGRPMLRAALFPFKRVIGVELEPRIHAICVKNIEIFTRTAKLARQPEAVCIGAGQYEFPDGDILLYLFNPFDEHILTQVAENLRRSIEGAPRFVRIIYFHPTHEAPLLRLPNIKVIRFETFQNKQSSDDISRVAVYEIAPTV